MIGEQTFVLNPLNRDFVFGRTPRPYQSPFAPVGVGCLLLFFTPFVLAGIATLVMAITSWYEFAAFSSSAVAAEATVIDKRTETDSEGGEQFLVSYRYSVAGDTEQSTYTGESSVSRQRYQQAEEGGSFSIVYLAFDPAQSQPVGQNKLSRPFLMTAFTLFWNAVISGILFFLISSLLRDVRITRKGQLVMGMLTRYQIHTDSDGDPSVTYEYRFATPDGQMLNGSYSAAPPKNVDTPLVGDRVAVLYADPKSYKLL